MAKIGIDIIQEAIKDDGWKIISTEYKNLSSPLLFECNRGHQIELPFEKIRSKRICPLCIKEKVTYAPLTSPDRISGVRRIIGLDQATHITGYSVFDGYTLVKYGTLISNKETEIGRDLEMRDWVVKLIKVFKPDAIAIEGIQYQENKYMGVDTFNILGRLQGILMAACYENNVPFEICNTNTWRKFCGVKGQSRADKKMSIRLLVKEWYGIDVNEDIADAIGIGKYFCEQSNPVLAAKKWKISEED